MHWVGKPPCSAIGANSLSRAVASTGVTNLARPIMEKAFHSCIGGYGLPLFGVYNALLGTVLGIG
ncbi:uncharacterized protein BDV14DRAFT_71154 [Aspergillus stella-maris]|uniref:uncharacterized protein n=1 Tax=Aspergillus stella-maris TaxID=1810926 RepID=UPI003CCD22DB